MDNSLVERPIKVLINPLQTTLLMDVVNDNYPTILVIMEDNLSQIIDMDFECVGRTIEEIRLKCFEKSGLNQDALDVYNRTGKYPTFKQLIAYKSTNEGLLYGPGQNTEVELNLAPFHSMFTIFLIRGFFHQFEQMISDHFMDYMVVSFSAMQESIDEIYEKSIALTPFREGAAKWLEILEMTGQFPDGIEN